jgi:glycosyltransferase involved in cell wall biosynthesis
MKISYSVADHGIPVLGRKGCSTHVRETCRLLMERGNDLTVFTPNRGLDDSVNPGLNFRVCAPPTAKWLGADMRMFLFNFRLLKEMRAVFRAQKPDVLYERYSLYCFAGHKISREFGLPRVLEVNARLAEEQAGRLRMPAIAQRFEDYLLRRAEEIIVVSSPLRESFMKLGVPGEQISIMPMAVDTKRFRPDTSAFDLRAKYGLRGKTIGGYVGTLTDWHGVDMLCDVALRFVRDGVDCSFLVLGGDPKQVQRFRDLAAKNGLEGRLVFGGSVPYDDVPSHINGMDFTVITNSTKWASPTKLFESQAMGKPVVAPDLVPIRDVMTHESEGLLFEPMNIASLSDTILRMVEAPDARIEMGRRARERVERTRSWEVNVDRILELYEKMLDRRGPAK